MADRLEYKSAGLRPPQAGTRREPPAPRIRLKPFCCICSRRHDFTYRCPALEDKR